MRITPLADLQREQLTASYHLYLCISSTLLDPSPSIVQGLNLLKAAHAGLWLVCAWLLEITFIRDAGMYVRVCVSVCLLPRLLITSDVIWFMHLMIR